MHTASRTACLLLTCILMALAGFAQAQPFRDATATHLPAGVLDGLSMDARSADFDDDGDLDLLIANEFRPNILLLNNGDGTFADVSDDNLPRRRRDSEDIAVADFDGDGDLDAVVVSEDDRVNEYYLNSGEAVFTNVADRLPVTGISNAVQTADFDGDGDWDLAIGNGGPDGEANALLFNDGDGFFTHAAENLPARADTTQDLAVGDIDNDGDLDMAVGNENDNILLFNDGSGVFDAVPLPLTADGEETRQAALGDIDADGDLDLFFANVTLFNPSVTTRRNRLLRNDGGVFSDISAEGLPPDNDNSFDGAFVDLDHDGAPDLITANAFPAGPYRAYRNEGGRFREATEDFFPTSAVGEGFDIEAADFDGNGSIDLFLCSRGGTDRLLLGTARPTAVATPAAPAPFSLAQNAPNPFNGSTAIPYTLVAPTTARLDLFNATGQKIRTLATGWHSAGNHRRFWDGRDDAGNATASGVYFYRLQTPKHVKTRLLLLVR